MVLYLASKIFLSLLENHFAYKETDEKIRRFFSVKFLISDARPVTTFSRSLFFHVDDKQERKEIDINWEKLSKTWTRLRKRRSAQLWLFKCAMGTSNLIGSGETYRMKYDSLSRDAIKYCLLPPRSSSARFLFDSGCLVGMRNRRRFSLFSLPRLVSRSATLTPTHCRFFLHFHLISSDLLACS